MNTNLNRFFAIRYKSYLFLSILCFASYMLPVQAAILIQQWTTTNGAKVLFVETHAIPVLDINVEFDAGSRHDPVGKSGVAALTNASMANGIVENNGLRISEAQILNTFADTGALHKDSVSMDRAGYSLRVLANQAETDKAIQLMSQLMSAPVFPNDLISRDKARLIAAIKEELTQPEAIAGKTFKSKIYVDHPYGTSATPETIIAITRDDLVSFHMTHYVANRAVISMVGDINLQQAKKIANDISKKLKISGKEIPFSSIVKLPLSKIEKISHPATQSHILMGMPALKRGDPDFFALTVGNYILGGGGFSSRLMQEVREKRGLSYGVYSSFNPMIQEGPFIIGLQTKKNQMDEALKVVNSTLDVFLKNGPTLAELNSAKEHLVNSFAMKMDNNRKVLDLISMIGYYNLPISYLDTWTNNIRHVSVQDIRDAFNRKLATEKIVTVIVGNEK